MKKEIIKIVIALILFLVALIVPLQSQLINNGLFVISYLIVGLEIVLKAIRNIFKGKVFDENFLMAIATIGAFVIGEYPEAVAVMLFYQIGEAFQDYAVDKSRKSIISLMDIRPDFANIQRNGKIDKINPEEVNVGDIIVVKPGEKVPLDGIIVKGTSMIDTSALTGESVPKEIKEQDEILSGCINENGVLEVKVTKKFGESTASKILDLVENASSKKSKSENFISKFAKYYTPIVVVTAVLLAIIPPMIFNRAEWIEWIHRALTFLVVSCPCALVISIPLGFFGGIGGASKIGVLVKGSNYLEALSNTEIMVLDKTGTLTQNKMTVEKVYVDGDIISPNQLDLKNQLHRDLLYNAILSNDSSIVDGKGIGDPTEYALLEMFRNIKVENFRIGNGGCKKFEDSTVENNGFNEKMLNEEDVRRAIPRLQEIPFDSDRKLMSVKCKLHDKETVLTKGALDVLLNRCIKIRKNNQVREISQSDIEEILKVNEKFSNQGLRVLSFAYKEADEDLTIENEKDFIFLGLIAMIDPPREESVEAVQKAKEAGIKTVMITGDHKTTAIAIAKKIGIFNDGDLAVTGLELDEMSNEELYEKINRISVYARVSPENKYE